MLGRAMMPTAGNVAADHCADRLEPLPAHVPFVGVWLQRQPFVPRLRPIRRAAKDDIISLVDGLKNANSATKPRMMPIKNLATNGPVGVLKRCCTIDAARIRALTEAHRIKPT